MEELNLSKLNTNTQTKETQADITPEIALQLLKEGNKRFVANSQVNRNLLD
jgi:carbonic anhydrase